MRTFICECCGGQVLPDDSLRTGTCRYCGNILVFPPNLIHAQALFQVAEDSISRYEFDEAEKAFGDLLLQYPGDHAAYWGLVRSRYGIKHAKDEQGRALLTICRKASENILTDLNYRRALELADPESAAVYRECAEQVRRLHEDAARLEAQGVAYDIVMTADVRGEDAENAGDIYNTLVDAGNHVYYAPIMMKNESAEQREAHRLLALMQARRLFLFTTEIDQQMLPHVQADWKRFFMFHPDGRMAVAYRGDPSRMQAPMASSELMDLEDYFGFQDKLQSFSEAAVSDDQDALWNAMDPQADLEYQNLLQIARLNLEGGAFDSANEQYEQILHASPRESQAYWGLLLCKYRAVNESELVKQCIERNAVLTDEMRYKQAVAMAGPEERAVYEHVADRIAAARQRQMAERDQVEADEGVKNAFTKLNKVMKKTNKKTREHWLDFD